MRGDEVAGKIRQMNVEGKETIILMKRLSALLILVVLIPLMTVAEEIIPATFHDLHEAQAYIGVVITGTI